MSVPAKMNMPKLDTQFVKSDGTLALPWYRIIVQLFRLSGASDVALSDGVYLIQSSPQHIDAYSTADNSYIATLALRNIPGPAPVPLTPSGVSPLEYAPETDGVLQVYGGKVELQRSAGGGGWLTVSLTGGSFSMLVGDSARVSWTGATPPDVEFWGLA